MTLREHLRQWSEAAKIEITALLLAYRHPEVPWYAKAFVALVVAYALSPIDLIPDVIPVIGLLDDLLLLPIGVALAVRLVPRHVLDQCRKEARERVDAAPAGRYVMAAVIIALWAVAAGALVVLCRQALR